VVQCDLADGPAVEALCRDIDAIVHFGGYSRENDWPGILGPNIIGAINLWEVRARPARTGCCSQAPTTPSGFIAGRSGSTTSRRRGPTDATDCRKAFGEDLACLYAYKHGVRGFSMRIGTCFPEPMNARALSSWMSYADLERLIKVGLHADYVNEIVYGVSRNTRSWWDNSNAYRLGYDPQDDAEAFADKVGHIKSTDPLERTSRAAPSCRRSSWPTRPGSPETKPNGPACAGPSGG
jgi:uronate dehydrogenase